MAVDTGSGGTLASSSPPVGAPAGTSRRARLAAVAARALLAVPSVAWTVLFFLAPLGPAARLLVRHDQPAHLPGRLRLDAPQLPRHLPEPVPRADPALVRALGWSDARVPVDRVPGRVHDRPSQRPASGAAAADGDDPVLDQLRRPDLRRLQRDLQRGPLDQLLHSLGPRPRRHPPAVHARRGRRSGSSTRTCR